MLGLQPQEALSRGLIAMRPDEDEDQAAERLTAVMNVLLHMEKVGVMWDSELSSGAMDVNGLQTLIQLLRKNSEGGRVLAVLTLGYITDANALIPEVLIPSC